MTTAQRAVRPFLIGSEWTTGGGAPFESINPATGELNALIGTADATDVDRAVQVAKAAQAASWRQMLPHQRAAILHRLANLIEEQREQLADIQMRQNGKLRKECLEQAMGAAAAYRYFAGICETIPENWPLRAATTCRGSLTSPMVSLRPLPRGTRHSRWKPRSWEQRWQRATPSF